MKTKNLKIYLKIGTVLIISIFFSKPSAAQFQLSGEIRPRTEFRNGFKTLNTADNLPTLFIEQRTRLNFGYLKENLGFKVSFQDIRMWGNTAQIYKDDPSLTNIFEAYAEYRFDKKWGIKVGRQALSYDNERFLGTLDWAQQSRSHDLLKFTFKDSLGFTMDGGIAFNQNNGSEPTKLSSTFYNGTANYKTMQYLWLHKDLKKGKISLLVLNDGRQKADSTTAFKQTYGVYAEQNIGPFLLHEEVFYQGGRTVSSKKVDAYMLAFSAALPKVFASPELGIDYLSGTSINSLNENAFDPAFGTNHKFYGHMDYFYVGNPHAQAGNTSGLIDIYLNTKLKTGKKSLIQLNFHQLSSPVDIFSDNTKLSRSLGQEIDIIYNLNVHPAVNFKLGYSQLFSTESLETIKGVTNKGPNQWAWTMIAFTPTFLNN